MHHNDVNLFNTEESYDFYKTRTSGRRRVSPREGRVHPRFESQGRGDVIPGPKQGLFSRVFHDKITFTF